MEWEVGRGRSVALYLTFFFLEKGVPCYVIMLWR
nr:MAG TPA: hypothetical protein [Caudoviricetes sp.]